MEVHDLIGNTLIISKKDRNLLVRSEVVKDYPWLFDLLLAHEKLGKEAFDLIPKEQQNFLRIIDRVRKQAATEWQYQKKIKYEDRGNNQENWIPCSLCGHLTREIYYIENQLNGTVVNVGSECVKEFEPDKSAAEVKREQQRLNKLNILNEAFKGIASTVEKWGSLLGTYEIVIPTRIETRYTEIGNRVGCLYEDFLTGKVQDEVYPEIAELLYAQKSIIQEMEAYIADQTSNIFIATRAMVQRLRYKGEQEKDILRRLKESGEVTVTFIHRIDEIGFMNKLIPVVEEMLKPSGYKVVNAEKEKEGYVIYHQSYKDITLVIKHSVLLMKFGNYVYDSQSPKPDFQWVVENSSVYGERAVDVILRRIGEITSRHGLDVIGYFSDYGEIYFHEAKTDIFYVSIRPLDFIKEYKALAFDDLSLIQRVLASIKAQRKYTRTALRDLADGQAGERYREVLTSA